MSAFAAVVIVTNLAYVAAFDTVTRCPAWVEYELAPHEIVTAERAAIPFHADPSVTASDNAADFAGSGFDRGHMAPAADFNFDTNALRQTYSFVNVCPMARNVNRGKWRMAEDRVRQLAASGSVRVVTFPVYADGTNRMGRVTVPDAFVKVAWGSFGAALWVVPNK